MSTTIFTGCSITFGLGFPLESKDPNLWVNLLHSQTPELAETDLVNLSYYGASNDDIFQSTVGAILQYRPAYAFVQWTTYPRYNVLLGLETYSTNQFFAVEGGLLDHSLHNGIVYSQKYLSNIRDRFVTLHHPHKGIVKVVEYVNILLALAKTTGTKIMFINGACPWDADYFQRIDNVPPSAYTKYTQKILDVETRDDQEVYELYDRIHTDYSNAGGIQELHWLNLYYPLISNKADTNDDGLHPGVKSNQNYCNFLRTALQSNVSS